ncbi:MAG: mercury transporter [bacterium]|nr:mercury transporter [bacterium]
MIEVKIDTSDNTATVTFEDTKATVENMEKALKDGGYPSEGKPVYLEQKPALKNERAVP